jgi:hypothetical protein
MPKPISQVCGPISTGGFGNRAMNTKLFGRCIAELRRRELNPFDQLVMQDAMADLVETWHREYPDRTYCDPILEVIYRQIFESRLVVRTFFLPDWETSHGARWEREHVTRLGLEVHEFPMEWYQSIMEEIRSEAVE